MLYTVQLKVHLTPKMAICLNETTCHSKHFCKKHFALGWIMELQCLLEIMLELLHDGM